NERLLLTVDGEVRIRGLRGESVPLAGGPGEREQPGPEQVRIGQAGEEFDGSQEGFVDGFRRSILLLGAEQGPAVAVERGCESVVAPFVPFALPQQQGERVVFADLLTLRSLRRCQGPSAWIVSPHAFRCYGPALTAETEGCLRR